MHVYSFVDIVPRVKDNCIQTTGLIREAQEKCFGFGRGYVVTSPRFLSNGMEKTNPTNAAS